MQESKLVKITTPAQFSKLVEIIEKKPYLARGYNKGLNKINIKDEWNVIADDLNSIGPPSRTGEGWLKVWAEFKLKKKLAHNKTESRATGGGSFKQYSLSPVEEIAVNLLGMHTIVQHKEPFGLKRPLCDVYSVNVLDTSLLDENDEKITDVIFNETNDQPSTSKICSKNKTHYEEMGNLKKSKKNIESDKVKLLEEQVELQKTLCLSLTTKLTEIERYTRKIYKVKEEKLKLFKDELKRKDSHRKELLKIRRSELEIKQKRLEIDLLEKDL